MSTTLKMKDGDIFIDIVTGKPRSIEGPEKCSQDLGEVLLTPLIPETPSRSATLLPRYYGSELAYIQAPIQYSGIIGGPLVSRKIQEAVDRLKSDQNQDEYSTPDERISKVSKLIVQQQNSTDFMFYLEVTLEGGSLVQIQRMSPTSLDHLVPNSAYQDERVPPRIN